MGSLFHEIVLVTDLGALTKTVYYLMKASVRNGWIQPFSQTPS